MLCYAIMVVMTMIIQACFCVSCLATDTISFVYKNAVYGVALEEEEEE